MPFKSKEQMKACFAKNDPKWDCKEWLHKKIAKIILDKTVRTPENILREGLATIPSGPEALVRRQKKFTSSSKGGLSKIAESIIAKTPEIKAAVTSSKNLSTKIDSQPKLGKAVGFVNKALGNKSTDHGVLKATMDKVLVNKFVKSDEYKQLPPKRQNKIIKTRDLIRSGETRLKSLAEKPSAWKAIRLGANIVVDAPRVNKTVGWIKSTYPKQASYADSTVNAWFK